MTRDAIETEQLAKLRRLLAALVPANRFYAPRLEAAGLDGDVASLDDFRRRMPFTVKDELIADQAQHPPYGTDLTYPLERYTRLSQTSGTTRAPLRWLDTNESWSWMLDNWSQVYRAAGVGPSDRVYFAFSFGPFLGFWTAFESAARLRCLCIPGGGLSSVARLGAMIDNRATVLCCTPTYALRLAEVAAAEKIDLTRAAVRTIIVAGEPGGSVPAVRQRVTAAWGGARMFDHHGMTEVGPVTFEAPDQPCALCVIESSYLAEIVDPQTGAPVAPGQPGELVLTTLGRLGSPLLRYRTGDLVKAAVAQDGGAAGALTLEGGILGRVDDMVLVRGVNVYPGAVDQIVRGFDEVAEYRVEVRNDRAMTELSLLIEPSAQCADAASLAGRMESALRQAFALRVPVRTAQRGELPRFEMKAKRWVRV